MTITFKDNNIQCRDCGHKNIDQLKCEKCGKELIKINGGKITIGEKTTPEPVANTDFMALLKLTLAVIKAETQPVTGHEAPGNIDKLWEAAFNMIDEIDKPKNGKEN